MKKLFGFGSSTPPPPPPPAHPPAPPGKPATSAKPAAPAGKEPAAPSIVGRWKEASGSDVTEFLADGKVIEKPAEGETIRGRYSFEGGKLKIKLDVLPEELVFNASLKDGGMELKDRDGVVTQYRRMG